MGDYSELKTAISSAIKTNGNGEITGSVLQSTLLSIVSTIGENATFAGIATPDTSPGAPDQNVFYLATQAGVYNNFRRGMTLPEGLSIIYTNGSVWSFTVLVKEATADSAGLMSATDKAKLDGLSAENSGSGGPSVIKETNEPGFFVVDGNRNIGFYVDNLGAHSANIVEFQNIE